jgi:hypothetical protein
MFRTTAAYLSGAICGPLWSTGLVTAGRPVNIDLRSPFNRIDGASFRDVLDLILMEEGGDFRHARFSADTVIRIERRRIDGAGRYTVHVRTIELANVDCADFVDESAYSGDFFGEED